MAVGLFISIFIGALFVAEALGDESGEECRLFALLSLLLVLQLLLTFRISKEDDELQLLFVDISILDT